MRLHRNRHLLVDRRLGLGKLTVRSSLYTLSRLGLGLVILCLSTTATASIVVRPGESIQAAVDAASPGETIVVKPGTYMETHGGTEAVRIKKDGIRLIGNSNSGKGGKVILVPGPGNRDGILAEPDDGAPDIQGFYIQGFTVQGFPNNGIKLERVNGFTIMRNESINNLENGIQPELSANGLVKRNVSYGSNDSALWVEGGTNVRVIGNVTHSSVTGLEVTISKDVVIKKNESYNNTVGMGLYHPSAASEPALPVMENWQVEKNYIHDNNKPNTAPPGSLASTLPPGGGILLLGVSTNVIGRNLVENNDFFGLSIIDYCVGTAGGYDLPGPPWCSTNWSGADPVPRDNVIERNTFVNNGTNPPPHPLAPLAADIVYVVIPETNAGNCFDRNTYTTFSSLFGNGPDQCL